MKKFLIPLLLSLYLIQLTLLFPVVEGTYAFLLVPAFFLVASIIFALLNIGSAVFIVAKHIDNFQNVRDTNRRVLAFKLLAIPFYVINLLIWVFMTGISVVMPGNIFFLMFGIPIGIGYAFLVLLSSSTYSIAILVSLRKNNEITRGKFVLHLVCQLIFVLDVIDQLVLTMRIRRITAKLAQESQGSEIGGGMGQ
ncbi:MAG: hypothetical protein FWH40_09245 [Coriobacteriia bacterium]|nr:hypothetical protein [Coriobacteriia bacterium]